MTLNSETKLILDAISALGNILEIVDREGTYLYCSENSNFGNLSPEEMLGRNIKDIYHLTDENCKVMEVIHTGIPIRDYVMSFLSRPTGKSHLWLYSAYPLIYNGICVGAISIYKPFSNVQDLVENHRLSHIKSNISAPVSSEKLFQFKDIVYASASMKEAVHLGEKVAKSKASILIIGETGTGKQLFAESIHSKCMGNRPFVAVNCAAIPDTLLESTLFGVTKGAYTGAIEKKGLFEQSENGTIFLDEIQTLSLEMQSKLLRVLEYKVVRRVGGDREIKVNPRIITAVNIDPEQYIKEGKLKPDLFYRIAVITLHIPPLRKRLSDIPLLVHKFIRHANKYMGSHLESCSDEVMLHFSKYHWPGNVRELQHCIDHGAAVMDTAETKLSLHDLPSTIANAFLSQDSSQETIEIKEKFKSDLKENNKEQLDITKIVVNGDINSEGVDIDFQEADYKTARQNVIERCDFEFHQVFLKQALKKNGYNVSRTAKELQISRQHLHKLMKQFKVER